MCLTHELCLTRFGLISMMRPELDPQWFGANPSTFGVKTNSPPEGGSAEIPFTANSFRRARVGGGVYRGNAPS